MKRFLARPQKDRPPSGSDSACGTGLSLSTKRATGTEGADSVIIERLPILPFLTIPQQLHRSFVLPRGCVLTEESIALRKTKTLGPRKSFQPYRPGDHKALPLCSAAVDEEEDSPEPITSAISLPPFEPLILWQDPVDPLHKIEVVPSLACKLREHQREGVRFLFECTMGLRGFQGNGVLLADDMGLGKTLMSITVLWTLLQQGFVKGESAARKVIVACPTSLVGNWENEIKRWVGEGCNVFAVKSDAKRIIENFLNYRGKGVLVVSYDLQRNHSALFMSAKYNTATSKCCDLLICDEAHKLKNAKCTIAKSLNMLPAKMRILLSGTPLQNDLTEFFNMVDFCNPGVVGSYQEFRRKYERPILAAKEAGASAAELARAQDLQNELSTIVNEFMLKRGNILNAQHLPPKLVQIVCCQLSDLQKQLYDHLLVSKYSRHIREGKDNNVLECIRHLISICCHPRMLVDMYRNKLAKGEEDEVLAELVALLPSNAAPSRGIKVQKPGDLRASRNGASSALSKTIAGGSDGYVNPEESGKLLVLYRLMQTMRATKEGERIVIVSNYTTVLNLIERMCEQNSWSSLRLDGNVAGQKRTKLVAEFNDPHSGAFAFLLSSKAGGCGINLIGGNRLVLFDPDWNPASDKQAAGRIWREGQKRRCFIYRLMSTCSIEEKIIQRQLSKEGLQNIVENKDQVNVFSTGELKKLFSTRRVDSRSDTHDTLRCKRCASVKQLAAGSAASTRAFTPAHAQECQTFLNKFVEHLQGEAAAKNQSEAIAPYVFELQSLASELPNTSYPSLPAFSRILRDTVSGIDRVVEETKVLRPFSILQHFLSRWAEVVSVLSVMNVSSSGEEADDSYGDEDEYVEQDGCPEEEDLNKWSHHCNVVSCDDVYLKRAMQDDTTISFLFGLEVNWDLLKEKQLLTGEAEEARKEQLKISLEALNKKRRESQQTTAVTISSSEDEEDDDAEDVEESPMKSVSHESGAESQESVCEKEDIKDSNKDSVKKRRSIAVESVCEKEYTEEEPNRDAGKKRRSIVVDSDESGEDMIQVQSSRSPRVLNTSQSTHSNAQKQRASDAVKNAVPEKRRAKMPMQSTAQKESGSEKNGTEGDKENDTEWPCLTCTYLNMAGTAECALCNARRGGGRAKASSRQR